MRYIAVDFDGTIMDHKYPNLGRPIPGAIYWMKKWIKAGAKIILNTMRSGEWLKDAVDYLTSKGIELYGVNENPDQKSWTQSPKVWANLYIDDAAFGCPLHRPDGFQYSCVDWSIVGPSVLTLLGGLSCNGKQL